jgi:hypothetical protein
MSRTRSFARLAAAAMLACGDPTASTGFTTAPPVTTLPDGTSGEGSTSTSTSTSTGVEDSAANSSTSAPELDAGSPPDFGPPQPEGCKGKIDFLFVISRTGTMDTKQQRLLDSFDGFITAIEEDFADFDSHIVVINPDGYWAGTSCESGMCPKYGNCGPNAPDYVCGSTYDSLCDIELAAGLLYNAGAYATNHKCELAGGRRYIVTKEEPDLAAQFECIARVGTSGGNEPTMKSIAVAVGPELNAEDGCNAGFLRPDALLVIVMIQDTGDFASPQSPTVYFNKVIASKGGDTDAIVMVAIINPLTEEPPEPDCDHEHPDQFVNELRLFAEKFPHRVMGNICADNYAPALSEAATVVKSTCSGFIPQ